MKFLDRLMGNKDENQSGEENSHDQDQDQDQEQDQDQNHDHDDDDDDREREKDEQPEQKREEKDHRKDRKDNPELPRRRRSKKKQRRTLLVSIAIAVLISAGAITFLALHNRSSDKNEAQGLKKESAAGQKVDTGTVKQSETERTLLLTGEARPYYSVTLYARVSGYMDQLKVDIGDVVKKDQLLAHVQSPEQEQAYNSAKASAFNLKQIASRTKILFRQKLISQQQEEQAVSQADVAQANLETQSVLRGYQDIVAPFDGIISNRFVDPGWLLQNASGSQAASQPLFVISKTDQLRLFVYVDQKDAPFVRVGDPIEVDVPNTTNSHQTGQVQMIAAELDPKTRTLLVETVLPNPDQAIVAGSFVQVKMKLKTPSFLELPVQALVMRKTDSYVPVVQQDGTLKYTKIDLAENDGERILVRSGLKVGEKVALNIGSTMTDGEKVQTVESKGSSESQGSTHELAGTAGTSTDSKSPGASPSASPSSGALEDKSQPQTSNQLQAPQPSSAEAREKEESKNKDQSDKDSSDKDSKDSDKNPSKNSKDKTSKKDNFDEGKPDSKGGSS